MGKDVALRLLSEGYVVYGAARRVEHMRDIETGGGVALAVDVTDDPSLTAAVGRIIREQGRIDVLINSAGYGQMGALEDVPMAEGRRQMEVNLVGVARLTQLCLPHMRVQKFGKIVNISSIGGKIATPLGGWYHASKFALEGYSDALRMEVRPFGIDVIVIEPAGTESEWIPIAIAQAERYSSKGAYAKLVAALRTSSAWQRKMPPASSITKLVLKALKSRHPRTRYLGGGGAGPILFMRKFLPDRTFDRIIMSTLQ
ncbi:oxidoreductase [Bradyrhizobium aeschynomenes]|uniref:oxidoreductase n=1 Tax=Bradyrhizobium aeschynomenes TaxID=2734909 RepID=UPI001FEE4678|nr:oxidoreductase [Bradyrhizobium aeschynomenes]